MSALGTKQIRNVRPEDKAMYEQPREQWPDEAFQIKAHLSWQVCEDCGIRPATRFTGRWLCGDPECEGKRLDRVKQREKLNLHTLAGQSAAARARLRGDDASY
jgi:hypothetical protein